MTNDNSPNILHQRNGNLILDMASIHEIITLLRNDELEKHSEWTIEAAFINVALLITCPHVKLPYAPVGLNSPSGEYGIFINSLSQVVSIIDRKNDQAVSNVALEQTKVYIKDNIKHLVDVFQISFQNAKVQSWIEDGINYRWQKDFHRENGIFDKSIIDLISIFTGISDKELNLLWSLSNRKSTLDDMVKHRGSDDFNMLTKAHLSAAIIRGIYHDYLAEKLSNQIYHHPIRKDYLPNNIVNQDHKINVNMPLSLKLYVYLLFLCSYKENSVEGRIKSLTENIHLSRKAFFSEQLYFNDYSSYDAAVQETIKKAKLTQIRAYKKITDSTINIFITVCSTMLGSLLFNGWAGAAVSLALSSPTVFGINVGEKIAHASLCSSKKLEKLIMADGGRIENNLSNE